MRGSKAKAIRRALAPRDKLKELQGPYLPRISRGTFFRETVEYEHVPVVKQTFNKARMRYKKDADGNWIPAQHEIVRFLGNCPRYAQQQVKKELRNAS